MTYPAQRARFPLLRPALLAALVFLPALLLAPPAADAGINHWTSQGPEGGWVATLASDPNDPDRLFAATYGQGVLHSDDGAGRWQARGVTALPFTVRAVAAAATDPQVVWAGAGDPDLGRPGSGVWRSTDGGFGWEAASGEDDALAEWSISRLVVDPRDAAVAYACGTTTSDFACWLSDDAGATWSRLGSFIDLALDATDPDVVYATTGFGVLRSVDGGEFEARSELPARLLAVDPLVAGVLYAVDGEGLQRSVDGGASWQERLSDDEFVGAEARSLAIGPGSERVALGISDGRLWISGDAGATWRSERLPLDVPVTGIARRGDLGFVAATAGAGLFLSTDTGRTWEEANQGFVGTWAVSVVPHPEVPGRLFAATAGGGLFRSDDRGATWTALRNGLRASWVNDVAIDPVLPDRLLAATDSDGVFVSTDGGASWLPASAGLPQPWVLAIAFDPTNPAAAYAGIDFRGVAHSDDGGQTWEWVTPQFEGARVQELLVDAGGRGWVLATEAGIHGHLRSTDGGHVFSAPGGARLLAVAADPSDPDRLYGTSSDPADPGRVYRSIDAGASWTSFALPAGLDAGTLFAISVHPRDARQLAVGSELAGVLVSRDRGASWQREATPFPPFDTDYPWPVLDAVHDPHLSARLWIGTQGAGVAERLDAPPLHVWLPPAQASNPASSSSFRAAAPEESSSLAVDVPATSDGTRPPT